MNSKEVRKCKGRLIIMRYKKNGYTHCQSGEITATTRNHILFSVNKGLPEITLQYGDIIEIISNKNEIQNYKDE